MVLVSISVASLHCWPSSGPWWPLPSSPAPGAQAVWWTADMWLMDSVLTLPSLWVREHSCPVPSFSRHSWCQTKNLKSRSRFCLCRFGRLSSPLPVWRLPCLCCRLILPPRPWLRAPPSVPRCRCRQRLRWCSKRRSPRQSRRPLWTKWQADDSGLERSITAGRCFTNYYLVWIPQFYCFPWGKMWSPHYYLAFRGEKWNEQRELQKYLSWHTWSSLTGCPGMLLCLGSNLQTSLPPLDAKANTDIEWLFHAPA